MDTTEGTRVTTTCTCGRSSEIVIRPSGAHIPELVTGFDMDVTSNGILNRATLWQKYADGDSLPVFTLISLPMREVSKDPKSLEDLFYGVVSALDSLRIDQLREVKALIEKIHQRPPFD